MICDLYPHPDNPRKDLGDLSELAESIKANGLLQLPTVVRKPSLREENYKIIIGHRRTEACKLAGLEEIDVIVKEMSVKEQQATMLMENIQRSDLNAYEQAKGFQMMMDLGSSVSEISEMTGFSDTTIRHRLKLAELDSKVVKEKAEQGATLQDFIRLEQIEVEYLKKKALEAVGTNNFEYILQDSITESKAFIKKDKIQKKLVDMGVKTFPADKSRYDYNIKYFSRSTLASDADINLENVDYYMIEGGPYGAVELYRKKEIVPEQEPSDEELEELRLKALSRKRDERIDELNKQFFNLRKSFAESINISDISTLTIVKWATFCLYDGYVSNGNLFEEISGLDKKTIFENNNPAKKVLCQAIYTALETCSKSYSTGYITWDYEYSKDFDLDLCYKFLEAMGYQKSDEEIKWADGTHDCYKPIEE